MDTQYLNTMLAPNFPGGLMEAFHVKGGFHVVKNQSQLLTTIPYLNRTLDTKRTTVVFVEEEGIFYKLISNPSSDITTLSNWQRVGLGATNFQPVGEWSVTNMDPELTDLDAAGRNGEFYFVTDAETPTEFTDPDLFQGETVTVTNGNLVVSVGGYWAVISPTTTWDSLNKPQSIIDYVNGTVIYHEHEIDEISGLQDALDEKYDEDDLASLTESFGSIAGEKLASVDFLRTHYYNTSSSYSSVEIDAMFASFSSELRIIIVAAEEDISSFASNYDNYDDFITGAQIVLAGADPQEIYLYTGGSKSNVASYTPILTASLALEDILTVGNSAGSQRITNLSDPTSAQDAATKAYVDSLVSAAGFSIFGTYADTAALIADQGNQEINRWYFVIDASDDSSVDSGWAIYHYLGTTDGDLEDYTKVVEEESLDVTPFSLTIENAGTPLTQRANINVTNGLTAVDNSPDTDFKLGGTTTEDTTVEGDYNIRLQRNSDSGNDYVRVDIKEGEIDLYHFNGNVTGTETYEALLRFGDNIVNRWSRSSGISMLTHLGRGYDTDSSIDGFHIYGTTGGYYPAASDLIFRITPSKQFIINTGSDATGDIYRRNSSGYFSRLAIGSAGDVLTVAAGEPIWQAPTSSFSDALFKLSDDGDNTKQLYFNASNISTSTTRTLSAPDASGIIVLNDNVATLTNKIINLPASTTSAASLNIASGVAPTSGLVDNDIWITSNHLWVRLNGVTYQLDQQGIGGGSGISAYYADNATMIAAQGAQTADLLYWSEDASSDATVTSGWAIYRYKGTTAGDLTDYVKVQEQESLDITAGIGGSTGSVGDAILRADGGGGSTLQASSLFISDTANLTLGSASLAGNRIIGAVNSTSDAQLTIQAESDITITSPTGIAIDSDGEILLTSGTDVYAELTSIDLTLGISGELIFQHTNNSLSYDGGGFTAVKENSSGNDSFALVSANGLSGAPHGQDLILGTGNAYGTGDNNSGDIYLRIGIEANSGLRGNIGFNIGNIADWQDMENGAAWSIADAAPTAGILNSVAMWVEDLNSSAELYVMSESGAKINISGLMDQVEESGTSFTLDESHRGKLVWCSNGSAVTVTVPAGLPVGFNCIIMQDGAGTVTLSTGAVTHVGKTATTAQYDTIGLIHYKSGNNYLGR